MSHDLTLTKCFAHFGITPYGKCVRSWWSDINEATNTVVVTLWTDHFVDTDHYTVAGRLDLPVWQNRKANRDRAKLLASVGVGGVFQSIVQVSVDPTSRPRKTMKRHIGPAMRLTSLDKSTGEFTAERVA